MAACKLPIVFWKGYPVLDVPDVLERLDKFSKDFEARDDDIWLCGYHKSGTHFMNEILQMITTGTTEPSATKQYYFVEMAEHETWRKLPSPRILNTHLPYVALPEQVKKSKIVFTLRNPKDVATSYFHHVQGLKFFDCKVEWDTFFETILADGPNCGSFYPYIKGWWSVIEKCPPNILVSRYEEMLENPVQNIRKIANFLGIDRDDAFIQAVAEATHMEVMRKKHSDDVFNVSGTNFSIAPIYRKGVVGDWRNHFTEEQSKRFSDRYRKELKDTQLGIEKYMD